MRAPLSSIRRPKILALALAVALLALPAAPAHAVAFGPDLTTATPNYSYGCGLLWAWQGCTVQDPLGSDMELVLPDPVVNGNQTGVVTQIRVKAAATAPAQFVVVEWSGRPNEGNPFPSGVMALSEQVTLQPGLNTFNTNLPVDRRLASNGFESWSVVSLNILDGTSPIPAQSTGAFSTMGVLLDNGAPLTQTTADLTAVPHNVAVGGLPPARLLLAGDVTITTAGNAGGTGTGSGPATTTPNTGAATAPALTLPGTVRIARGRATARLSCAGPAACAGTLRIQSRPPAGARRATTYAAASFKLPAGKTAPVSARLTKAGRKAVRGHRSLVAYANATFSAGGVKSAKVKLKR